MAYFIFLKKYYQIAMNILLRVLYALALRSYRRGCCDEHFWFIPLSLPFPFVLRLSLTISRLIQLNNPYESTNRRNGIFSAKRTIRAMSVSQHRLMEPMRCWCMHQPWLLSPLKLCELSFRWLVWPVKSWWCRRFRSFFAVEKKMWFHLSK